MDQDERQLTPEARGSSRWMASLRKAKLPLLAAAVIALGGGLATRRFLGAKQQTCREIVDKALGEDLAVIACQREYDRTKDPSTGALLANALYDVENDAAAKLVAQELLETKARPDALYVLASLADEHNQHAEARSLFEQAEKIYVAAGDWEKAAKNILAWTKVTMEEGQYVAALEQLDRCMHMARKAGSKTLLSKCHLGASFVLTKLGADELAGQEIQRAIDAGGTISDDFMAAFYANYLQESQDKEQQQAALHFEQSLGTLTKKRLSAGVHLNLAYSLADIGRIDEAIDQLERAKVAGSEKDLLGDTFSIAGLIEMKRGDLAKADELLARSIEIFSADKEWDDIVAPAMDRAEIALTRKDLAAAVVHARVATNAVEQLRAGQAFPHYRSWLTERYRLSYELLFLALAKQGRADEALEVVDQWMGRGAIDALTPKAAAARDLAAALVDAKNLEAIHRYLESSELSRQHSVAELRQRLANEDVIVVVIARNELWRVSSHQGQQAVSFLGNYATLSRDLFDRFKSDPLETERANPVGALLLPEEIARGEARPLHVVLDERLTTLPVEAMRLDGQLILASRPIVRGLRPSQIGCEPPLGPSPKVTVVADAVGDLPGALRAAKAVADRFAVPLYSGKDATRARLAEPADLLHVGVHGDVGAAGGLLALSDGDESGIAIATRGHGPAITFLAACKSALAEHGSYSMAAAFLAAGSHQVLATLHSVKDELAERVTVDFYKNGGEADPATAMAKALTAVAAAHSGGAQIDWPRFAVFGRATCKVSPRARQE